VLLDGLLTNLIENVGRHAPPPAPLSVTADEERGRVRLIVEDGGPGLAPAARDRLFSKFQPLPSSNQGSRPGLGLGLAIVRGMAEAMGGSVIADQSPLGGLRIVVDLPGGAAPVDEHPGGRRAAPITAVPG
jgi:two-component system sensor histidine kinase KdpD